MGAKEEYVRLHGLGNNCAQRVLCSCCEYTGLDEKTALAVAGGFGGGVRCGEICGTVSGAVMAVGMAYPYTDGADKEARALIADKTREVIKAYMDKYGSVRCTDLKEKKINCEELIEFGSLVAENVITNK